MRNIILGLAAFWTFEGACQAEVINCIPGVLFSTYNQAGNGFNIFFKTGDALANTPSNGSLWRLDKITLFRSNFTNVNNGNWTVDLLNSDSTATLATQSFSNATSDNNGFTTLDFTNFGNALLASTTSYNLKVTYNGGAPSGFAELSSWDGTTINYDPGQSPSAQFSNVAITTFGSDGVRAPSFRLFATTAAVPEPGTLLLGGIAACSGAAGAWWKRRKRKATQPETTDQLATA